jgi:hypothetical protein
LARSSLTWTRLGVAATLLLVAAAACSKSTGSAVTAPTAVPSGATASPTSTPTPSTFGVAYLPDGGNGGSFTGVQFVHFEDTSSNLLPSPANIATPQPVAFPAPVGPLAFATDGSVAVAAMGVASAYTQIQGMFGVTTANLVPAGLPYISSVPPSPTAAPTVTAPATAIPTSTPQAEAVVADVRSISVFGTSTAAVALLLGNPAGILGVSSLTQVPPLFSGFYAFNAPGGLATAAPGTHQFIATTTVPTGNTDTNGNAILGNALVRGTDLLSVQISVVNAGYGFRIMAENPTLGIQPVSTNQRGRGAMAFSPADPTRALIAQAPGANDVTLVTGLPAAITKTSTITLPSRPHSVAIASGGQMAVVGADNGYYVIGGVNTSVLTLLVPTSPGIYGTGTASAANQPNYVGADGVAHNLTNITSVGFSADGKYLAVLGSLTTNAPGGGTNATLVALPFNQSAGASATPTPTNTTIPPQSFTQNNFYAPAVDQDLLVVR